MNKNFISGLALMLFGFSSLGNYPVSLRNVSTANPHVIGPYAAAQFPDGFSIHGVGGDTRVLFAVVPSQGITRAPGVYAAHRVNGQLLGAVVPPPNGWITPQVILIEGFQEQGPATSGTILVSDSGGTPSEAGQVTTFLHRFRYAYSPEAGFQSTWLETHRLPVGVTPPVGELPSGIVYAEGVVRLPDGTVAVNDTFLGAIWVAGPSLEGWRLAMIDPTLAAGTGGDLFGIGRHQGGGTHAYHCRLPPGIPHLAVYPGIHSMTYASITDEVCMVRTAPPGGIWCIKKGTLLNPLVPAAMKALFKRTIVPPSVGLSDLTDGLTYDSFHPDSVWLYWARAISDRAGGGMNTLRRVSLLTGEIQTVASSNELYDWTSNIAALPPLFPTRYTTIFSAMGQLQNNPEINVLLNGLPAYVSPTLLPLVEVER